MPARGARFVHRRMRHGRRMRHEALDAAQRLGQREQLQALDEGLDRRACRRRARSVTIAPNPDCWRRAISWPGWPGRPGNQTLRTPRWPASQLGASALALRSCTRRRACSVRRPRSVRKLSNGEARQAERSSPTTSAARRARRRFAITAPPTTSLWPLMYLVVECTTRSAPSASGAAAGDRKVLSSRPRARRAHGRARPAPRCRRCAAADCSASRSRAARASRERGLERTRITEVDEVALAARRAVPGAEQPERAAVAVVRRDDARSDGQQVPTSVIAPMPVPVIDAPTPPSRSVSASAEQVARRVAGARVVVLALVAEAAEGEGRGQVDRRHDGAGDLVGLEAGAHGAGGISGPVERRFLALGGTRPPGPVDQAGPGSGERSASGPRLP
jgi:hypothetical protein